MLIPAAVLVFWTMIMLVWMFVDRTRNYSRVKFSIADAPPGARGQDLAQRLPPGSDWPAHNYVHLLEQPTVFYAACVILALSEPTSYDHLLAWGYVAVRIVHSIWQAKVNTVPVRAGLFMVSTMFMFLLAIRALLATLG